MGRWGGSAALCLPKPDRRAGERGAEEVKSAESAVSREEKRDAPAVTRWPFLVLTVTFICRERSFPDRFAKNLFGIGLLAGLSGSSGGFEGQDAAVVRLDFLGFPRRALMDEGRSWVVILQGLWAGRPRSLRVVDGEWRVAGVMGFLTTD